MEHSGDWIWLTINLACLSSLMAIIAILLLGRVDLLWLPLLTGIVGSAIGLHRIGTIKQIKDRYHEDE